MIEVKNESLDKLRYLFNDIRFYMGKSVLDGKMGQALADNIMEPTVAILLVRSYCFISGKIDIEKLKEVINQYNLNQYIIIPSDGIKKILEIEFKDINKYQRYSIKKDVMFDIEKLKEYANYSYNLFEFTKITEEIANKIKEESFINITDNYKKNGIGYCCFYNNNIIGVASSNIIYKDGIEVNIKVKEEYRGRGIATKLASMLILSCLEEKRKISWDAANLISVGLAKKLGFEYDSEYDCYKFF